MATATEQFLTKFHSLDAATVGERRKSLFLLLNNIIKSHQTDEINFSQISPKTHLEEIFKVEVFIYFKRIPELLEIIKSGRPIHIAKVLKHPWFFHKAFENINGTTLVTEIFPHVSFSVRSKILTGISKHLHNEKQADEFFDAVMQKYGMFLALKLVPCCSIKKIIDSIHFNRVKLSSRHLLNIIKKHPTFTKDILWELQQYQYLTKTQPTVFKYLVSHDNNLLVNLLEEYGYSLHLGRRATAEFVSNNKKLVIEKAKQFMTVLHGKYLPRRLADDYNNFYLNLFPATLEEFHRAYGDSGHPNNNSHGRLFRMLRHIKKERQFPLFSTSFEATYNKPLWDFRELVTSELVILLPQDEKEEWIFNKFGSKAAVPQHWIRFLKPRNSIPLIKETLLLTSDITTRASLIPYLIDTCRIYDDKDALVDVCEYLLKRHRNDNVIVRKIFINKLMEAFDLAYLQQKHWNCINELLQLFKLNDETFTDTGFCVKYIQYHFINELPVREVLADYAKDHVGMWNILEKFPNYQKVCLKYFQEIIPEIFKDDKLEHAVVELFLALINWNIWHPHEHISLCAYQIGIDCLIKILEERRGFRATYSVLRYILVMEVENVKKDVFHRLYLQTWNHHFDVTVVKKFIRVDPLLILHNLDVILDLTMWQVSIPRQQTFWRLVKKHDYLGIPQQIISTCLKMVVDEEDKSNKKARAVFILSHLMGAKEFLNLITPFYPKDLIADCTKKEERNLYSFQKSIAFALGNVDPPLLGLESIGSFCKGDYLKIILRTLYNVAHNIPEMYLPPFLNILCERAVSVRKHALFLTCKILSKTDIFNILNKQRESEKNPSIRRFIFTETYNYFLKSPEDMFWELLKLNIELVDVKDQEAFNVLLEVNRIPQQYLVPYTIFVWEKLNDIYNRGNYIVTAKCRLLQKIISEDMTSQMPEFCLVIIESNLLQPSEVTTFERTVNKLACIYIFDTFDERVQSVRLNMVFGILKNYIQLHWQTKPFSGKHRRTVYIFLEEICTQCKTRSNYGEWIMRKFAELWNTFLKPHEAFQEYLLLQLCILYFEVINAKSVEIQLGAKIAMLCDKLLDVYSASINTIFCDMVRGCVVPILNPNRNIDKWHGFINSLLNTSESVNCSVLAINLLSYGIPTDLCEPPTMQAYYNIIDRLSSNSNLVVQIHLNAYIKGAKVIKPLC